MKKLILLISISLTTLLVACGVTESSTLSTVQMTDITFERIYESQTSIFGQADELNDYQIEKLSNEISDDSKHEQIKSYERYGYDLVTAYVPTTSEPVINTEPPTNDNNIESNQNNNPPINNVSPPAKICEFTAVSFSGTYTVPTGYEWDELWEVYRQTGSEIRWSEELPIAQYNSWRVTRPGAQTFITFREVCS